MKILSLMKRIRSKRTAPTLPDPVWFDDKGHLKTGPIRDGAITTRKIDDTWKFSLSKGFYK